MWKFLSEKFEPNVTLHEKFHGTFSLFLQTDYLTKRNLQSYFTQSDYDTNLDGKGTRRELCATQTTVIDRRNQALEHCFTKNNYRTDFIGRNTYISPNDSSNDSYTTTAIVPYIKGTSETIARILRPYKIRVAQKPIFTTLTH